MQGISLKESVSILEGVEYYEDRLERLFFIEKEEIPGRFNDGSNISDFFWREATPATARELVFEIKRLIYKYEPDLNVSGVSAGLFPMNGGQVLLLIEIECYLKNDPNKKEVLSITKVRN